MASSQTSSNENSPRQTYRVMAGVAVVIILLMGLAIYSLSRMQTAPWASPLEAPDLQTTFRKDLPAFEPAGGPRALSPQLFEGKWTLLTFWTYTCLPCLEEMPGLNELALSWQGPELQVLAVNTDKEPTDLDLARRFLTDKEISIPTFYDQSGALAQAFDVREYPRHFLVNPEKKIVWDARGAFKWNEASARDQLLKLIEQQAPEAAPDPVE